MAKHTGMDVENGAMPQIRAATDPQAKGGEFYGPRFVNNGGPCACRCSGPATTPRSPRCGQVSERETGVSLEVG